MRKAFILIIPLLLLLTGCTQEADRIYTVCKIDDGVTYVYSSSGVYSVSGNELTYCYDANVEPKPVLQLFNTDIDFNFEYILPGLYQGSLEDVSSYVHYMVEKDNASFNVVNATPDYLEVLVTSDDYSARILYNINGEVRIYFIDNFQLSITPLYILDEE